MQIGLFALFAYILGMLALSEPDPDVAPLLSPFSKFRIEYSFIVQDLARNTVQWEKKRIIQPRARIERATSRLLPIAIARSPK